MSRNMVQKVLYILVAIPVSWLFLRYFLPISLPFLLGLGAALAAEPGVKLLSKRLPRPAATIISVTLVLILLTTVLALALGILMRQLGRLQTILPQLEAAVNQGIALLKDRILTLSQALPQALLRIAAQFSMTTPSTYHPVEMPQVVPIAEQLRTEPEP